MGHGRILSCMDFPVRDGGTPSIKAAPKAL
jgi:hypothetical protein